MKNKVTRDLSQSERTGDDKVKALRNMLTESLDSINSRNDVTFELVKDKQKEMSDKLELVETSEVMLDYINKEIKKVKDEGSDRAN